MAKKKRADNRSDLALAIEGAGNIYHAGKTFGSTLKRGYNNIRGITAPMTKEQELAKLQAEVNDLERKKVLDKQIEDLKAKKKNLMGMKEQDKNAYA